MLCPECKRQNPPDAVYCENCGNEIQTAAGAPIQSAKRATKIESSGPADANEFWRPPGAAPVNDPFKARDPFAVSVAPGGAPPPPQANGGPAPKRSTMYDPGSADPFKVATTPPPGAAPSAGGQSVGPYTIAPRAPGLRLIGWLVTFDDANEGFSFTLTEGRNSIGRDDDRDLRIEHQKISGRHCCIQHRANPDGSSRTWIFDENSTNGTVLNGNDIFTDRPEIKDGDVLKIGAATFLVKLIDHQRIAQLWGKK